MKKSIVFFLVAILMLSTGFLVPHVLSQTQNLKVVNYSYYVDPSGYLDVVGRIEMLARNTVYQPVLEGSIYTSDGTDQGDSIGFVWSQYLAPQQEAPFDITFQSPNNSPDGTWYSLIDSGSISNIVLTVSSGERHTKLSIPRLKTNKMHFISYIQRRLRRCLLSLWRNSKYRHANSHEFNCGGRIFQLYWLRNSSRINRRANSSYSGFFSNDVVSNLCHGH